MYLNIILTILVATMIFIVISTRLWWKNFGKEMFTTFLEMKNTFPMNKIDAKYMTDINEAISKMLKKY